MGLKETEDKWAVKVLQGAESTEMVLMLGDELRTLLSVANSAQGTYPCSSDTTFTALPALFFGLWQMGTNQDGSPELPLLVS